MKSVDLGIYGMGNDVFVANSIDINIVFFFVESPFLVLSNAKKKKNENFGYKRLKIDFNVQIC